MFECVRQTVAAIQAKISSLQTLCNTLEKEFEQQSTGNGNGVAAMPTPAVKPAKPKAKASSPTAMRGDAARILAVAEKFQEPMRITEFAVAAGIPKSSAKSSFDRWLQRGWIKKTGFGEYVRMMAFPHGASSSSSSAAPRVAQAATERVLTESGRVDAKKKLEAALKQRDQARLAGRDAVERIYQEEINKLEEQLAS